MHLDIPQKIVGTVEQEWIDNLRNFILENEEDWYKDDYRRAISNITECNSIPLRHSHTCATATLDWNRHHIGYRSVKNRLLHDKYEPYIEPFLNRIKEIYPNGTEYMSLITRLPPGGKIGGHTDNNLFGRSCHRIHIPIQTAPGVEYLIAPYTDQESNKGNGPMDSYYWSTGNIYEFSNERWHAVHNNSKVDRIHLIFNVYNLSEELKNLDTILENNQEEYHRIVDEVIHYYTFISNGIDRI